MSANGLAGFMYEHEDTIISLLGLSTFKTMDNGTDTPCFVNCSKNLDCSNGSCICPVSLIVLTLELDTTDHNLCVFTIYLQSSYFSF